MCYTVELRTAWLYDISGMYKKENKICLLSVSIALLKLHHGFNLTAEN
jgi:hypothetical protein